MSELGSRLPRSRSSVGLGNKQRRRGGDLSCTIHGVILLLLRSEGAAEGWSLCFFLGLFLSQASAIEELGRPAILLQLKRQGASSEEGRHWCFSSVLHVQLGVKWRGAQAFQFWVVIVLKRGWIAYSQQECVTIRADVKAFALRTLE